MILIMIMIIMIIIFMKLIKTMIAIHTYTRPLPGLPPEGEERRQGARVVVRHGQSEPAVGLRGHTERPHPQKSELINLINLNCSE